MKKRFTILIAAFALLTMLCQPNKAVAQNDYSTDYTGNITLSTIGGSNASTCVINISGTGYNGIKAGTSSKTGAVKITVPSGTKYLHIHAAAWNGTTASLAVTPTGYSDDIELTANTGISNNSPFTFNGDPSTEDFYKVITFSSALTADTDLTFTAVGGKRFVIWGVTSELDGSSPTPSITAANVEIAYNATSGAIEYTINNPATNGQLTATTDSDWLTVGTIGATVPFTCLANEGALRTATVTLTYTYGETAITKNVTVTQDANPYGPGSETNPYTVAQARAAIDANFGTQGVYARGIVSAIPTAYNATYGNITFNMVDNQGDEEFLQAYRCGGDEAANVMVGDVVVVYGNLTKYNNSTYEFGQGCVIVELTHPSVPTINPATFTINVGAEASQGTVGVSYANVDLEMTEVVMCDANGDAAEYDWIPVCWLNEDHDIIYQINANLGEARTAYLKVCLLEEGTLTPLFCSDIVTINQAAYVAPTVADLPFAFNGGLADIEDTDGLTQEGLGDDYNATNNPTTKLKFNNTGDWLLLQFNEVPGTLTFDIKGNSFSGGTFNVQTSEDGVTFTDLEIYNDLTTDVLNEEFDDLGENVRYIKWIYTEKVSGNVGLGNIHLYEEGGGPVIETYNLTIEPFENLEIFTFIGGNENDPFEGAGTIQVAEGDQVMLSVSAEEGYVMQSLMVDGVEHVNDINDDLTYTFTMPSHDVTISATAVEDVPFEPVTYTLATTIESGRSYIIVGSKTTEEEIHYYAMGEQKNTNRKGVEISVDGTTATVETADVYEFVISSLGDGLYSIYDEKTPGYLYAASPSANQLKTETELDSLGNGNWVINFDTLCSIVASNNNNRNVMQFNYNGGNTLFSCYASASQSPVYLYVKDETPSTVTQTIELTEGWNYVSTYIDLSVVDGLAMLEESLGDHGLTIATFDDAAEYIGDGLWIGLEDYQMTNAEMVFVEVDADCTITLQGPVVDPSTVVITIGAEWTLFGFPVTTEMNIIDALGSFEPEFGDGIGSIDGLAEYLGDWDGDFTTLKPGQGYFYWNESGETKTFVFRAGTKAKKANKR